MPSTNQSHTLHGQLIAAVKKDPKKALFLTALLAVLLCMWGRMAMNGGKLIPRSATAMTKAPIAPSVDKDKGKPKAFDSSGQLHDWLQEPLPASITRNLFEKKLDYFPVDGSHPVLSNRTSTDPTFWERLAKSLDAQADQQHKREILIQNLRQQAAGLEITSTVMGPRPKAMINGAMVGEGEVVAQFRVEKIEARSVIVEREGIRLEIPMK